jgi:hypothetical protein
MLLLIVLVSLSLDFGAHGQRTTVKRDVLDVSEAEQARAVEQRVAKRLQALQKDAHVRVMGRWSASERNVQLTCTLARTGELKEREGTEVGVESFISSSPENDPALQKLVTFPQWQEGDGEYSFHHFDVAAWPMRDDGHKGSFAVRIEMRQGLYWDWADSHITDDSLNKDWWRKLVAPECK